LTSGPINNELKQVHYNPSSHIYMWYDVQKFFL